MKIGKYCDIAKDFKHGKNLRCGSYVKIESGVVVGDNVTIENFVLLRKGTHIGDNVFVDSYVRSSGDNVVGNNVTLRYGCTLAREVVIEDNVYLSPNVMTIYSKHTGEKVPGTVIGKASYIGTNAVIGPGIKIAPKTVVGAMALVTRNIEKPGVYVGIPANKKS